MNALPNLTPKALFSTFLSEMWEHANSPHIQVDMTTNDVKPWAEPALNLDIMSKEGILTLNLGTQSIGQVSFFDDMFTVQMRFSGRVHTLNIPYVAISIIYDRDADNQAIVAQDADTYMYSEVLDREKFPKSIEMIEEYVKLRGSPLNSKLSSILFERNANGLASLLTLCIQNDAPVIVRVKNEQMVVLTEVSGDSSVEIKGNIVYITTKGYDDPLMILIDGDNGISEDVGIFSIPGENGASHTFTTDAGFVTINPKILEFVNQAFKKSIETTEEKEIPVEEPTSHAFSEVAIEQNVDQAEIESLIDNSANVVRFPKRKG